MEVAVTTTTTFNRTNAQTAENTASEPVSNLPSLNLGETAFELGLWLSGLESFLNIQNHSFVEEAHTKTATRDWAKEFRLTHSTLLRCSRLSFQLAQGHQIARTNENDEIEVFEYSTAENEILDVSAEEIFELTTAIKDAILVGEGLRRAAPLKFGEWTAWCNSLTAKLKKVSAFDKLIKSAEKSGENFLPEILKDLIVKKSASAATEADLKLVLPRIGKILKWLSVIEEMIKEDKPLKPSLLLFARIYEQIRELMSVINNRLLRFSNQDDELYAALDGAVYIASIELRKVYQYELIGITDIRPTPQARARIEASQGLLIDSFRQTLTSFARLLDPSIEPHHMFAIFQIKLDEAIILRQDLWQLMNEVRAAEQNPDTHPMLELNKNLENFVQTSMRFLMYKDWETFERFVEEVVRTSNKKDLTPILHRFGAYLETMFGQVNMRSVLANHPFEMPAK